MIECHTAGNVFQVRRTVSESIEQTGDCCFAFARQYAIHGTAGVSQNFFRDK